MDEETGNIYNLDFELVTNMNDNLVIDDGDELDDNLGTAK